MSALLKLKAFVADVARAVDDEQSEALILARLSPKLKDLVSADDWLPPEYAISGDRSYQQHLLYADPLDRFSIVSFVWGPGQGTPIHDHRVWGLVGVLRGEEVSVGYERRPDGSLRAGPPQKLLAGQVVAVSPRIGDIHAISNGLRDRSSISIHVYGGNIGEIRRSVFDAQTGVEKEFVSGYSNVAIPNLWRAAEAA